jgi:SnoaL-like polyketide cyclase
MTVSPRSWPRFSDIAHRDVSYVEEGDAFADAWVFVGKHTGPLVLPDGTELPPTGKRVEVPGTELVRGRDGKIVVRQPVLGHLSSRPSSVSSRKAFLQLA